MGKLYVVPTPVGNLQDMTPRAIDTLRSCGVIAAEDTRHTQKLLNCFDIKTRLISYHKFNEKSRCDDILKEITDNDVDVALVTDAGTPCISDPGYELVRAARDRGVEIIGLAGASAAVIALSISGIDTGRFTFYGFLPRKKGELYDALKSIVRNDVRTFVLYESPKRIVALLEVMAEVMADADVCLCKELTKLHERCTAGKVTEVLEKLKEDKDAERGEYVVVGRCPEAAKSDGTSEINAGLHGIIFDKIMQKGYSLKEAVSEVVAEGTASKNEAYKASLEVKDFLDAYGS